MSNLYSGLVLPRGLDDIDAAFMTRVLRHSGVLAATNEVVSQEEKDVGMTAGYFSAIKKVRCTYKEATEAQDAFVVKAWPPFEIMGCPCLLSTTRRVGQITRGSKLSCCAHTARVIYLLIARSHTRLK